jgi:hypothetical protein
MIKLVFSRKSNKDIRIICNSTNNKNMNKLRLMYVILSKITISMIIEESLVNWILKVGKTHLLIFKFINKLIVKH